VGTGAAMTKGSSLKGLPGVEKRGNSIRLSFTTRDGIRHKKTYKLDGVELPIACELEMQDVMRFGQRRQEIVSVVPTPAVKPAPPAGAR